LAPLSMRTWSSSGPVSRVLTSGDRAGQLDADVPDGVLPAVGQQDGDPVTGCDTEVPQPARGGGRPPQHLGVPEPDRSVHQGLTRAVFGRDLDEHPGSQLRKHR
jgi:hypothetical protein